MALDPRLTDLEEGDRVRLRRAVERYPHFLVEAGATGTVSYMDADTIDVTMDEHVDGAEEWENAIVWCEAMETLTEFFDDVEVLADE